MNILRQGFRQARFENKAFWRNPAAAFFTFAFPILFLVVFTSIFNDTSTLPTGVEVSNSTYYTASILAFSVVTACFTNVAMSLSASRDQGILKRVRGTPLPPSSYVVGKLLHSIFVMAILVVIVCSFGFVFYDIDVPTTSALAFVVTLMVGAATFCSLGVAATALIPNAEAAPAVVNGIVMPLLFVSGVFIPIDGAPGWMKAIGSVFPIKPFLESGIESFIPPPSNPSGWSGGQLLAVAVWGVIGLLAAARFFNWEPRR